jgi:hypothetical protein
MLRARVWIHELELDAALAGGADPAQSDELALRARQLAGRKKRDEMASAISRLITIVDDRRRAPTGTSYAAFRSEQDQANHELLLKLELRMRGYRPVALRGLALTSLLLDDGRRPRISESAPATLERAVRAALSGLDDDHDRGPDTRLLVGTNG